MTRSRQLFGFQEAFRPDSDRAWMGFKYNDRIITDRGSAWA